MRSGDSANLPVRLLTAVGIVFLIGSGVSFVVEGFLLKLSWTSIVANTFVISTPGGGVCRIRPVALGS